jgi:hypothetical protein
MKIKRGLVLGVGMATALLAASQAKADITGFDIGEGNTAISGFPGPYAHVQVNLTDSTHATITFTSLSAAGNIYLMGDGGTVAVNVNASSWTIGSFSASNAGTGFTPGPLSDGGSGNQDGFGSFNQTVNSFDGFTHSSDSISFILTDTGGTWASAANVLTPNANGSEAATHIFVTSSPANAANGALATGFAAVPEPSTLIAGALLLLPFGASTLRIVRGKKAE